MTLYKLTCLSPVFIGTGEEVCPGEYLKEDDGLRVLNARAIYTELLSQWYHQKATLLNKIQQHEAEKTSREREYRQRKRQSQAEYQSKRRQELEQRIKYLENKKSLHFTEFRQLEQARRERNEIGSEIPSAPAPVITQGHIAHLLKDRWNNPRELLLFLEEPSLEELTRYHIAFGNLESRHRLSNDITLHEMVKTGQDEAFIPGSSIKGAMRTCLAYHFLQELIKGDKFQEKTKSIYHSIARVVLYLKLVLNSGTYARQLRQSPPPDWADNRAKLQQFFHSFDFPGKSAQLSSEDIIFLLDLLRVRFFDDSHADRFRSKVAEGFSNLDSWGPGKIGQKLSQMIFGWSPSTDILRNLSVSDTFVSKSQCGFTLYPIRLCSLGQDKHEGKDGQLEYAECIAQGACFQFEMQDMLNSEQIEGALRDKIIKKNFWLERQSLLEDIPAKVNAVMGLRVQEELNIIRKFFKGSALVKFYEDLLQDIQTSTDAMFLRIGSRCGWSMTTVSALLGPQIVQAVRTKYHLGSNPPKSPAPLLPFPKTRHLIFKGPGPCLPLGWVKITKS